MSRYIGSPPTRGKSLETGLEAALHVEAGTEAADPELHRAEAAASVEAVKTTEAAQEVAQTTEDVLGELEAGLLVGAGTEAADEGVLEAEDPVEVGHVRQGLHRSPSVQSGCFVTANKSKNCPEAHPNSRGPVQLLYDPAVAVEDSGEQRFVSTTTRAHKLRHGGNCRPGGRAAEWWKNC